jgi:cysteinyl-tRNA synthetase
MRLYNTLSREVEEFKPLDGNRVGLYTCGLTVYSQPHIGNWVAYIYWDVLQRTLIANNFDVTRVQNITDVGHLTSDEDAGEDKMLKGALREGKSAWEVADTYIAVAEHEAYDLLGLLKPTYMPRATDYIPQQIAFVEELERKGYTYTISDGVYFDTSKLSDYGKLARLDIDGLQFGARVADMGKRTPTDFAIWKFSNPEEKRDMEWDSPWGKGFPGWHLECSVMARELLGDTVDIHTGGIDHIPVHHTNEIAQSEAVTGKTFANYWLHANHMKVNDQKMSKSLGNIYTLQDITEHGFDIMAFKLMVLSKHYRTEGNFTWEIIGSAQNSLKRLQAWADLKHQALMGENHEGLNSQWNKTLDAMHEDITNDLNTPSALAHLYGFVSYIESNLLIEYELMQKALTKIDSWLGLNLSIRPDITDNQKQLLHDRQVARDTEDWSRADSVRQELKETGIVVRDTSRRQIWERI